MAQAVQIREAKGREDTVVVRELMREYQAFLLRHPTGSAHFCMDGFEEEMAILPGKYVAPGGILLAETEGGVVGCIAVREVQVSGPMAAVYAAEGCGLALELKRLWVRPETRGHGGGRALMEAAIRHARQQHARWVFLDTVPEAMPGATRMYESLGFSQVPRYNANKLNGVAHYGLRLGAQPESAKVTETQNPTIS